MGTTYSSSVLIGLQTTRDILSPMTTVHGCEHKHLEKFCPECGSPATKQERQNVDGYDGWDKYKGLDVHRYADDSGWVIIGTQISYVTLESHGEDSAEFKLDVALLASVLADMKTALKDDPLVEDSHAMGVWHVMDVV